jgi:Raf kinase inhibitor-like YbhB/YbcL family protein
MRLSSPNLRDGASIPERFTCDGDDVSPPLVIEDIPDNARSLAIVVDDPDAPSGTFVHWLLWNLPADKREVPEGIPRDREVRQLANARQGTNDFRKIGYGGPCPPRGEHHYRFHLYAVDDELDLNAGANRKELEQALEGHVVAEAELVGTYRRAVH